MKYEEIQKLFLERGFFSPSSEIYPDSPAGFWDYGPLGLSFRNKFVDLWRRELVRRDDMLEIDGSQILSKNVFIASGHLENFSDPIVNCLSCNSIFRADRMIADILGMNLSEKLSIDLYDKYILDNNINCPSCNSKLSTVSNFNLMYKIGIGPKNEESFLRPETCQTIFLDFLRLSKTMRIKLPIGLAQFGKSFRNEISPRQSLLRLREFYQAEIEVFFNPDKVKNYSKFSTICDFEIPICLDGENTVIQSCTDFVKDGIIPNQFIAYYLAILKQFFDKTGIDTSKMRFRKLSDDDRAFYSSHAFDFEVLTSLGWIELVACNDRSDFDLSRHSNLSGKDFTVMDGESKILPHVFEISMGIDRSLYSIFEHSSKYENQRFLLSLKPYLSPFHIAIFPLVNKNNLPELAYNIYEDLKLDFNAFYDESGSIGRRYRRQDQVGTPFCITVDFETLESETVTLRNRDSMEQIRIPIKDIKAKLQNIKL